MMKDPSKLRPEGVMRYCYVSGPVGRLMLAGDEAGLRILSFQDGRHRQEPAEMWQEDEAPFREAARQLGDYFAGRRHQFELRLAPVGTPFQREVWQALQTIPFGETLSYAGLAARVGRPAAFRAVGAANGRNPIAIIIPCHRVVGTDGSLTGFGGGLEVKGRLLALERASTGLWRSLPLG